MPRRAHTKEFTECRQLARDAQSTNRRNVHANEINQTLADQRHIFVLIDKELAHRERRGGLLSHDAKVVVVLRREQVFEEKQVELLQLFSKADRLNGWNTLVHVVQQFDLVAKGDA